MPVSHVQFVGQRLGRPRAFVLIGFCLLLLGKSLSAERTTKDPVFWSDYYTLVRAHPKELLDLKQRLGILSHEIHLLKHEGRGNIYQIRARHFSSLKKVGANLLESPPFSLLVPSLPRRKHSFRLEDKMQGYKDYALIKQILYLFEKKFPKFAKVFVIGRSTQGRPILALKISDHPERQEDEPAFLFNAAHHGNEVLSPEYALDLAYYLLYGVGQFQKDKEGLFQLLRAPKKRTNSSSTIHYRSKQVQFWIDNYEIWIVPVVNPDGYNICWSQNVWAGRKNGRNTIGSADWQLGDGVDLNRNYPFYWNSGLPGASSPNPKSYMYRGPRPASEPETRSMMRLAERERFVLSFSYHTYATRILVPYTVEEAISPAPQIAWSFAEKMLEKSESYRTERDYIPVQNLYAVDGTDQDWLFSKFGTLAFIVEGSYQNPPWEVARKSIRGLRPVALQALNLFTKGPVITLHTIDSRGRPIGNAHVRPRETVYYENEDYTTHPATGRYDLFIGDGGRYSIELSAPGYEDALAVINCYSGHCRKTIVLKKAP